MREGGQIYFAGGLVACLITATLRQLSERILLILLYVGGLELKDITMVQVLIIMQNHCGPLSCSKAACFTLTVHEGLGPFVKGGLPDLLPHGACACAQGRGFTHRGIEL